MPAHHVREDTLWESVPRVAHKRLHNYQKPSGAEFDVHKSINTVYRALQVAQMGTLAHWLSDCTPQTSGQNGTLEYLKISLLHRFFVAAGFIQSAIFLCRTQREILSPSPFTARAL